MALDRRGLLATGLLLALGGCATSRGVTLVVRPGQDAGELETLRGVTAGPEGLALRVVSNGCTTKADFAFYVRDGAVAFARKRLDICRAAPSVTTVRFSYGELGLADGGTLTVLNPVATP